MNDKELFTLWKRYVDSKNIYRAQPEEFSKKTKKEGLLPNFCPYKKIRPEIEKLYELVIALEKKGHKITLNWKGVSPSGSKAVKVSREDLNSPFIDFTLSYKEALSFKKRFKGGAITDNVKKLIKEIKKLNVKLKEKEKKTIKELEKWMKKKKKKTIIISIKGSSKVFEKALFQHWKPKEKKYWNSPYGSFEHFKKIAKKEELKKYLLYLKGEKNAHVRVTTKIPAKEIKILKK